MSKTQGRPTKLNGDVQDLICNLLERAIPVSTACEIAGITDRTYQNWRKRGKDELDRVENGHPNCRVRKEEQKYVDFFRETTRARAESEQQLTSWWYQAAEGDWRASMELLQRKFPERWSKKQKLEHTGKDGSPIETASRNLNIETDDPEELSKLYNELFD